MKFFQGSPLISLAILAITCGYFSFAQADTAAIDPMLDNLFAEWLKKQQADQAPTEAVSDLVPSAGQPEPGSVAPVNAPEALSAAPAPAAPVQQPIQSFNPFLPPFAPNPFLPQVAPNPALPLSPYLDPTLNPYAYYPYLSPFGFPMKIKKKKV